MPCFSCLIVMSMRRGVSLVLAMLFWKKHVTAVMGTVDRYGVKSLTGARNSWRISRCSVVRVWIEWKAKFHFYNALWIAIEGLKFANSGRPKSQLRFYEFASSFFCRSFFDAICRLLNTFLKFSQLCSI
jgi:hypothetical protein